MAALDIPLPEYNSDGINEIASSMTPNSRDDISAFGNELVIEASSITSQLARYFTMQVAKPNYTIAVVNEIIADAKDSNAINDLIQGDPSWLSRSFSKPRILPADQMPMARLVEKAMALPKMAEKDNEAFGHDLKIVDHALKDQQERLSHVESDRGDVMDAIVSATTPERVGQRLPIVTR